jgi:hypothetical protein
VGEFILKCEENWKKVMKHALGGGCKSKVLQPILNEFFLLPSTLIFLQTLIFPWLIKEVIILKLKFAQKLSH